jgi:signal peptidase I
MYVDGISMTPTYNHKQWTLMQRVRSFDQPWSPDRFDVVVVWSQKYKLRLCKRVIGLPGETVQIIQGRIFIDGEQLLDSFGKGNMVHNNFIDPNTNISWLKEYENIPPKVIASDHVWVIGDYREDSYFGHFSIKDIRGKIVLY